MLPNGMAICCEASASERSQQHRRVSMAHDASGLAQMLSRPARHGSPDAPRRSRGADGPAQMDPHPDTDTVHAHMTPRNDTVTWTPAGADVRPGADGPAHCDIDGPAQMDPRDGPAHMAPHAWTGAPRLRPDVAHMDPHPLAGLGSRLGTGCVPRARGPARRTHLAPRPSRDTPSRHKWTDTDGPAHRWLMLPLPFPSTTNGRRSWSPVGHDNVLAICCGAER